MTDPTSSDRLLARTVSSNGRPVRKDEIELVDRGLYIESWLPERRSRRKPILFVHGELGGSWVWERYLHHFAGRGWEGHALNLRNHFWSATADPTTLDVGTYTEDVIAAMERLGPTVVVVGHGLGGLLALKALERVPASAYVLIAPEPPRDLRDPARPHVVRDVPDAYGRAELGWETLPEKLTREHRDLTLGDVLRIQHMLGQKPFESGRARRQVLQGVPVDRQRAARRPAPRHRRRGSTRTSRSRTWSGSRTGSTRPTSRSAPTRTTGSCSASRATSRSPRPCACSWRPTASSEPGARGGGFAVALGILRHRHGPPGAARRIRLEAQDTALSRRRSPVRIRYAVPLRTPLAPGPAAGGFFVGDRFA